MSSTRAGEWLDESALGPHRIPLRCAHYSEASSIGPKSLVLGLGMSSLPHSDGWEAKIQIPRFLKHTMM